MNSITIRLCDIAKYKCPTCDIQLILAKNDGTDDHFLICTICGKYNIPVKIVSDNEYERIRRAAEAELELMIGGI